MNKSKLYKNKNKNKNKTKNKKKLRSKVKTKKFKNLKCAPSQDNKIDNNLKGFSCYSNNDLKLMKNLWNSNNSNINKIHTNNNKEIWSFFKENLNNKCYNELCWLNENTFNKLNKEFMIKNTFRPFSPESWKNKPYEWLSSVDILKVLKQYENKFKDFKFIGPSPIDFDTIKIFGKCVFEDLCKFDLKNYINNNYKKIGIIFNLDPHYKDGSHWVALFINIEKFFIFYFDSNGDKIPKKIKVFVDRIIKQGIEQNINFLYDSNENIEHQKKDGQCGMYTLYFIIELLKENRNINDFKNKNKLIKDEVMKDFRNIYYNSN